MDNTHGLKVFKTYMDFSSAGDLIYGGSRLTASNYNSSLDGLPKSTSSPSHEVTSLTDHVTTVQLQCAHPDNVLACRLIMKGEEGGDLPKVIDTAIERKDLDHWCGKGQHRTRVVCVKR